jgi:murein DD-endopeptidase MepM/ murein hydrolase activator NlpD
MRSQVLAFRSRALGQVALVTLLAGMTAACSGSQRLSEPFFTGSTQNQREIIGQSSSDGGYQAMPPVTSNAVSRNDLPPPTNYGSAYASAETNVGGSGYTPVGGKTIALGPSDNLDNLSAKFGVPPEEILMANQLSNSSQITAGRTIIIPRRVASTMPAIPAAAAYAPPADPIAEAPTLMATGGYVVQAGDTLFGIARQNGTTVAKLVEANGLASPEAIRVGQTLRIDGGGATQVAALGAPEQPLGQLRVASDGTPLPATTAAPAIKLPAPADVAAGAQVAMTVPAMPSIPVASASGATQASATAAIDEAVAEASSDGKSFRWPVRGRIISGFGTKPNGEKNDGINLAVPEGTSVKAVEAGTVIYAGNELEGYGNLILVRHADGWVSAYAHNKEILVKRGDQVRRGQTVSYAGMTGSVTSPQVHFELRKGAKPVNPLDYLAGT